jgi:hypothetical protein
MKLDLTIAEAEALLMALTNVEATAEALSGVFHGSDREAFLLRSRHLGNVYRRVELLLRQSKQN